MNGADARILWEVASVLARDAAKVSHGGGRTRPVLPRLLFFTDRDRTPRPWETAARLPAGSGVVFRHFGRTDARETALRLREVTQARDTVLLIGLDAELADAVGADGVHLPERVRGQAAGLAVSRPEWLVTAAAHSPIVSAVPGLDALVLSPVFPAGGGSAGRPAVGLATFRSWVGAAPCPVYALGGIESGNAPALVGSGACGIAGVSAIQAAFGPD